MLTRQIAQFAAAYPYDAIPAAAITAAKNAILDFLGVSIAGSGSRAGKLITRYSINSASSGDATIIASGATATCEMAALANGALAHAEDYDDISESWNSHPTATLFPCVLALAEKNGVDAKELLAAYITGWEVAARLGRVVYRKMLDRAGHATALVGPVAAAAAASRILRLSIEQTQMAIGIAASQASGIRANDGTDTKPLHAGFASSNGVRAAQLAALGLTSNPNIIEEPYGYLTALAGKDHDMPDVASLGKTFDIVESLCIKSYPCCYNNQRPIDSMFHLIRQHGFTLNDVAQIEMKAHPHQERKCRFNTPRSGLEAKFSLTYSLAAPLVHGEAGMEAFEDEKVLDSRVNALLPRIRISHVDAPHAAQPYRHCGDGQLVSVRLNDGRLVSYDERRPRGHASNPFTLDEIAAKFSRCAAKALSPDNIRRCIDMVGQLENLKDVRTLLTTVKA